MQYKATGSAVNMLCRAEREAWKERHPGHRVEGCMFHMCQVIQIVCEAVVLFSEDIVSILQFHNKLKWH